MNKIVVFSLFLLISTFSCKKIKESTNKYAPYKLAVQGLTKRYNNSAVDMKEAENAKDVAKVLGFLAASHKIANRMFHKFKKQYPELENSKSKDFPENLHEIVQNYQRARKRFGKELSKKMKQFSKDKLIKSQMAQWIKAAKNNKIQ
ncbi:MAG: hypothetical protein PF689_07550 [Deltaproteobacteria bacterium]|jgi:hypothetical protein|nr:hypothetical protein [Deltaproteobacteria bacterium]